MRPQNFRLPNYLSVPENGVYPHMGVQGRWWYTINFRGLLMNSQRNPAKIITLSVIPSSCSWTGRPCASAWRKMSSWIVPYRSFGVYHIKNISLWSYVYTYTYIYDKECIYIYILDRVYLYIYYCHSCAILAHFCLIIGFHACESSSFGTDPGRSTESSLSHRRSINWGLHVYEIQHHVSQHIPPPAHCLSGDDGDLARSRCGPHTNGYKRDDFHSTITNFSWFQHHKSSAG